MDNRELDKRIALEVMGYKLSNEEYSAYFKGMGMPEEFKPSESIEDAFEVVEKLREKYRVDLKIENNTCFCTILDYKGLRYDASNKHIATVICLAALKIDSIGG